jgi:hypothetical protein
MSTAYPHENCDEARKLLAAGRPHLAAVAARIVLERAVAERCWRLHGPKPPGVIAAAKMLELRGRITLDEFCALRSAAKVGNRAAHGRPVNAGDVAAAVEAVARFVGTEAPRRAELEYLDAAGQFAPRDPCELGASLPDRAGTSGKVRETKPPTA